MGYRRRVIALIGLCAVVATATASAQISSAPHTLTAQGNTFFLDGQPFFPILSQVRSCPDAQDTKDSSKTIADDMAAIGVNVLQGLSTWCGVDTSSSPTQTNRLNGSLQDRMKWVDLSGGRGPQPSNSVTELTDWQAPPLVYADSGVSLGCGRYSARGLYNQVASMRGRLFVANVAISSPSGGEPGYCVTPQRIQNAVMTVLAAGARGLDLLTTDPVNATRANGFSVSDDDVAAVRTLMKRVTAMAPMLLGATHLKVSVSGNKNIVAAALKFNGKTTVIVVNTSDRAGKATVMVPSLGKVRGKLSLSLKPLWSGTFAR